MKNHVRILSFSLIYALMAHADSNEAPNQFLQVIGEHKTGAFDEGAAEIVAHDPLTQRLFKVNAKDTSIDVLDMSHPNNLVLISTINASDLGGSANSVAVHHGVVAVAIEAVDKQSPGMVAFYDAASLSKLNSVKVGALPDMVTFTPNGQYLLVANEGEPNADYTVDPDGSVSVIDLRDGVENASVKTASFTSYNGMEEQLRAQGVRIFGPAATASQDLEPEYITVSRDSRYAWVSLQEANALAKIDIKRAQVLAIQPLGFKDHLLPENALDASNKDNGINIAQWPVKGMYMPDAIASYMFRGKTYIVTANEGDSRDYDGYSEEERVKDISLDPVAFPNAAQLKNEEKLGRLKITAANGDIDGDGDYDELFSFGARSFSIRDEDGGLVYDSGSDFETITAKRFPEQFNSDNDQNNSFDSRSDDKGPEPEGVVLGEIKGRTIAFIGLERIGGIMAYDVTDPYHVKFIEYINHRDFAVSTQLADGSVNPMVGDLGPEGMAFIPARHSPIHSPLLVIGNEVSGTTTVYRINDSLLDFDRN